MKRRRTPPSNLPPSLRWAGLCILVRMRETERPARENGDTRFVAAGRRGNRSRARDAAASGGSPAPPAAASAQGSGALVRAVFERDSKRGVKASGRRERGKEIKKAETEIETEKATERATELEIWWGKA